MAFLWRGRLYVVRGVIGHWRERRDWWSTAAARALQGEEWPGDRPVPAKEPSFAFWSGADLDVSGEPPEGPAEQHDTSSAGPAAESLHDSECEVWRVEASTGRAFGNGVYDLSRTPATTPTADSWRLLQVAD